MPHHKHWQLACRGETHSVWFSRTYVEYLERLILDEQLACWPMQRFAEQELADFECSSEKREIRRAGECLIIENGLTPDTWRILRQICCYGYPARYESERDTEKFKQLGLQ